jgi:hypothetical protein
MPSDPGNQYLKTSPLFSKKINNDQEPVKEGPMKS